MKNFKSLVLVSGFLIVLFFCVNISAQDPLHDPFLFKPIYSKKIIWGWPQISFLSDASEIAKITNQEEISKINPEDRLIMGLEVTEKDCFYFLENTRILRQEEKNGEKVVIFRLNKNVSVFSPKKHILFIGKTKWQSRSPWKFFSLPRWFRLIFRHKDIIFGEIIYVRPDIISRPPKLLDRTKRNE